MSAEPRPQSRAGVRAEKHEPASSLEGIARKVDADLWAPIRGERTRLSIAAVVAAVVAAAHVARVGTLAMRLAAAFLVIASIVGPAITELVLRRRARDPARMLRSAGPALGASDVERALAHIDLAERIAKSPDHEGVSPSLARLHAARALDRLPLERLAPAGERRAVFARWTSIALFAFAAILLAIAPARFIEGVDVGIAQKGVAPLPLVWLEEPELTVHPPQYLHKTDAHFIGYGKVAADRGAILVVHGVPRRPGRTLLLADDTHEVAFLDDGSGGLVARWSVAVSGRLRVRARFGNVVVEEPAGWDLIAIADESPRVELEGAPGQIEIAKSEGAIPLRYDAYDDHGLREVHLVLRVGTHEERRVLAKLDGEPRHDRGGYVLRTTDPLIQKARTPVRVRVEARDNDPITGPKWGRSDELTLIPPVIGAAEAARYQALAKERDAWVDLLAQAIEGEKTPQTALAALQKTFDAAAEQLEADLSASHEGMRFPPRLGFVARGRLRKIREALAAEAKSPNGTTHAATIAAIEKLLLGLDGALRSLGFRDTRAIAKILADVADDGADGLHDLATAPQTEGATARVDVDVKALDGGGASMRVLGELGRDLGEIVENDLRRVARARDAKDLWHAELALRDLAQRLREPVPSFGGGGGGGGRGTPGNPGSPTEEPDDIPLDESEGEKGAGNVEEQVGDLVKEHSGAIGEVEDELRNAEDPKQLEGLEEEAKRRAKRLRDAVADLPKIAGLRKTLEASEAASREKTEGMADSLEKLQLGDAKERGESALKALEDARDKAWMQPGAEEKLNDVGSEIQKQLDWIDDVLKKIRKSASEKAKPKLQGVAPKESGLGEKAEEIGKKSEQDAPLPGPIKDLLDQAGKKMKDAAEALKKGDGETATEAQKQAQRLLEKARDMIRNGEEKPSSNGEGGKLPDPDEKVDIPKADEHKGPEELRKRVLKGLGSGSTSPRLQDAVKRYTEGLLK